MADDFDLASKEFQEAVRKAEHALIEKGLIIEAGFAGLSMYAMPHNAPPIQVAEMRKAFFSGAMHCFTMLMRLLEPGAEPTDNDLHLVSQIDAELKRFRDVLFADARAHVEDNVQGHA